MKSHASIRVVNMHLLNTYASFMYSNSRQKSKSTYRYFTCAYSYHELVVNEMFEEEFG